MYSTYCDTLWFCRVLPWVLLVARVTFQSVPVHMVERRGSWVTIAYCGEYCIICIRRLQLIFLQNTSCLGALIY